MRIYRGEMSNGIEWDEMSREKCREDGAGGRFVRRWGLMGIARLSGLIAGFLYNGTRVERSVVADFGF